MMYEFLFTRCPDDDIWNGVPVNVGYVQGVSEACCDAAAITILDRSHLCKTISSKADLQFVGKSNTAYIRLISFIFI